MADTLKKLSNSYLNGIAKAMDAQNSIKIPLNATSATVSSAWKDVGNEIFSSMKAQNDSLLKSLHTTSNKSLQTKISKIMNDMQSLETQRDRSSTHIGVSTSLTEALARVNKQTAKLDLTQHKNSSKLADLLAKLNKQTEALDSTHIGASTSLTEALARIHKLNK